MTNKSKTIFAVGIIGLMIALVWLFSRSDNHSDTNNQGEKYVSSKWDEMYGNNSKNPQGLYLFNNILKSHLDTNQKISVINNIVHFDSINRLKSNKTYLFVGKNFGLNQNEIDTLLTKIKKGSTMFLSYENLYESLHRRFFSAITYLHDYADHIDVKVDNKKHRLQSIYQNDTVATKWWGFDFFTKRHRFSYTELSEFQTIPNFLKLKYEKGSIYLNTIPKAFVNYQLKRQEGFDYASFVIEQLPKNQSVYILELGRVGDPDDEDFESQFDTKGKNEESYWKEILKEPSLTKALIFSVLMAVLFLVFRSRRRRPVVEHIEKKKDMSRAFAETISSIYFSKRNPAGLLQVQKKNFYDTIQRHFFIDLSKRNEEEEKELQSLAEKSNVDIKKIKSLLSDLEATEIYSITDEKLAQIAQKQQQFYLQANIISDKIQKNIEAKELTLRRALLIPSILILAGILLFFIGMNLMIQSNGLGVVLWPISFLVLILGIIRMSNPLAKYNDKYIEFYTVFGIKKKYFWDNLQTTEPKESGVILWFEDNKRLILSHWDMSRYDKTIFKQLIEKLNTLKV